MREAALYLALALGGSFALVYCAPFWAPKPFVPVCDCRAETAHVAQVADVALRELEACRAGAEEAPTP